MCWWMRAKPPQRSGLHNRLVCFILLLSLAYFGYVFIFWSLKMIRMVAHRRITSLCQDVASLYTMPYGACKKLPGQDRSKGLFQSRWILPHQDKNPYHDASQKPAAAHSRKTRKVPQTRSQRRSVEKVRKGLFESVLFVDGSESMSVLPQLQ